MVINAKIVKEVTIEPLDAVNAIRKELGLEEYFIKDDKVYQSERCSWDGDYRDVQAPSRIQDMKDVIKALDTLTGFLKE